MTAIRYLGHQLNNLHLKVFNNKGKIMLKSKCIEINWKTMLKTLILFWARNIINSMQISSAKIREICPNSLSQTL